jgi:hypothetical protein
VSIDDTVPLPIVQPTPQALTAADEESETKALVDELGQRFAGVRVLAPSRADESARKVLREELARMVATALQFDAHLSAGDWAEHDARLAPQFKDWATAPGGMK